MRAVYRSTGKLYLIGLFAIGPVALLGFFLVGEQNLFVLSGAFGCLIAVGQFLIASVSVLAKKVEWKGFPAPPSLSADNNSLSIQVKALSISAISSVLKKTLK